MANLTEHELNDVEPAISGCGFASVTVFKVVMAAVLRRDVTIDEAYTALEALAARRRLRHPEEYIGPTYADITRSETSQYRSIPSGPTDEFWARVEEGFRKMTMKPS